MQGGSYEQESLNTVSKGLEFREGLRKESGNQEMEAKSRPLVLI